MAELKMVLDGAEVAAREGETLLELARRLGKDIPTLCHDPRLAPFTACFLCLVELEGKPGFVPACGTRVAPGMRVRTDSPDIQAARKLCLELVMSTHHADCVAPCRLQCPDSIDIQTYLAQVASGDFAAALETIKRTNPFPSVCGRVCPHTCELACRRNKVDEPVAINPLKRFVADLDRAAERPHLPPVAPATGKRVAVVGAGPAGLTAAYYLRQKGHAVTVLEMNPEAGGMLRYGIPRYRLPADALDREIALITALGVEILFGQRLGRDFDLPGLKARGFDAVFLAVGAWTSTALQLPGEDMPGVLAGIDYLYRVARGERPDLGRRVVVVGGGNTAIDAARTARRMGAEVTILYRRTRKEMPAAAYEVDEAEREGVKMHFLAAPLALLAGSGGRVGAIRSQRMELGEPDASGRRRPVPVPGSDFEVAADTVVAAIGQRPEPRDWADAGGPGAAPGATKWATVEADERTYQSKIAWVFAAGDCLTGAATAVEAIAGGRKAAISIDRYLRGLEPLPIGKPFSQIIGRLEDIDEGMFAQVERQARAHPRELPVAERLGNFREVELGLDQLQALAEGRRCLECGCAAADSCDLRALAERYGADLQRFGVEFQHRPLVADHPLVIFDPNKCILCGRCVRICLEQQGAGALGFVRRGFDTSVRPSLEQPLLQTDCDACGQCVGSCPTGALAARQFLPKAGPYPTECTQVACGFCGWACRLGLEMVGRRFVRAGARPGEHHNRGNLCVDGSFGHRFLETLPRLRAPGLGRGPARREAGWDEALRAAGEGLGRAARGKGVAVLQHGPLTNEDAYLLARLARGALLTPRLAMLDAGAEPFVRAGLRPGLRLEELGEADRVWVLGTDPLERSPVAGVELRRLALAGCALTVLSARPGRLDQAARRVLRVPARHQAALLRALAAAARGGGLEALEEVGLASGVKAPLLLAELEALGAALRPAVVACDDLADEAAEALLELLATLGRPDRLLVLRGAGNALGRLRLGLHPATLPGALRVDVEADVRRTREVWGGAAPGAVAQAAAWTPADVLAQVRAGAVDAVLAVNTDPYGWPFGPLAAEGVFSVALELGPSALAAGADVALPAAALAESAGTVLADDGRVLVTAAARPPVAGRGLFEVLAGLAAAAGQPQAFGRPAEVWAEIGRLRDGLGGLGQPGGLRFWA
ncbi:MAG TPA: FAD-dependent oxidoreductase [Myxococcota bacterium]|nr:FAD-dependent oxidoreductase [Myxococcota bacterium]HRY95957.1 FAD-dependent oxidoreductase [Myxococcota bacterium]HSA22593.1 FAD-dependent oxidoreductase [Myxococcota bacterium]